MPGDLWDLQPGADGGGGAEPGRADDPERDAAAHHLDAVPAPAPAAGGVAADAGDGGASDREVERGDDPGVTVGLGGRLAEQGVEAAGRDEAGVDVAGEHPRLLEGLDAHFGAEGARGREAEGGDLGGEHHLEAEHLLLVALEGAVVQGSVVRVRGARDRDAVVEAAVELSGLEVHGAVDVDGAREAVEELDLAVAVGGVEVGDYFVPHALGVLLRVVEVELQAVHAGVWRNSYMFIR